MDFVKGAVLIEKEGLRYLVGRIADSLQHDYRMNIVCANDICGLAPVCVRHDDGAVYAQYKIGMNIPFTELIKTRLLTVEELLKLLSQICAAVCLGRRHLLSDDGYILDERHIYIHPVTMDALLIYCPDNGLGVSLADDFRRLIISLALQSEDDQVLVKNGMLQEFMRYVRACPFDIRGLHASLNDALARGGQICSGNGNAGINERDTYGIIGGGTDINGMPERRKRRDIVKNAAHYLFDALGFIKKDKTAAEQGTMADNMTISLWEDDRKQTADTEKLEGITDHKRSVLRKVSGEGCEDIAIDKPLVVIGRASEDCDGVIMNNAIGRLHARIVSDKGCYGLSDNNSVNGTFLNDKRLIPETVYTLKDGDRIAFADCEFIFEYEQ